MSGSIRVLGVLDFQGRIKLALNACKRGRLVYTSPRWEAKMDIPAN
jgi:hypothetical protein